MQNEIIQAIYIGLQYRIYRHGFVYKQYDHPKRMPRLFIISFAWPISDRDVTGDSLLGGARRFYAIVFV